MCPEQLKHFRQSIITSTYIQKILHMWQILIHYKDTSLEKIFFDNPLLFILKMLNNWFWANNIIVNHTHTTIVVGGLQLFIHVYHDIYSTVKPHLSEIFTYLDTCLGRKYDSNTEKVTHLSGYSVIRTLDRPMTITIT